MIHLSALSYQPLAASWFPSFRSAIARNNQSWACEGLPSFCDFVSASIAAFQFPARYCAAPSVFQNAGCSGASSVARLDSSTARGPSRKSEIGDVASSQAKLL